MKKTVSTPENDSGILEDPAHGPQLRTPGRVKSDVVRYLQAHRHPWNLRLHYAAFLAAFLGWIFLLVDWRLTAVFAAIHYLLSWTGHFGFEKNKPASFRYPLLGFYAGFAWFFVRTYELGTGRRVLQDWEGDIAAHAAMQVKREEPTMTAKQDPLPLLTDQWTEEEARTVRAQLMAFNQLTAPTAFHAHSETMNFLLKDEDGSVTGGLLGRTYRFALYVEILWVHEKYRGRGLGGRLIAEAEEAARLRGCKLMHLDTFSFQAPEFYRKMGFEVFGVLDGFPEGYQRYYLKKTIEPKTAQLS
ncbi:GNAT family N-acetyltransferase [Paenibacillus sp. S-38]|uniref:GNAT family N-acetyltransferase n=1 Tax=Paenibacillus sp. S-38 TaxID=3416710 RepID=UPI003CEDF743